VAEAGQGTGRKMDREGERAGERAGGRDIYLFKESGEVLGRLLSDALDVTLKDEEVPGFYQNADGL